jgi:ABC-2 type transport system permease protein
MAEARAAGTIYDLGYQTYSGTRLGRNHAIANLIKYSFKAAFGIGRGPRAKIVPMFVAATVFLPAIVRVGVASTINQPNLIDFAGHLQLTAFSIALFVATQAPELIVTDKQQGVLSLYLSRPITARDYALSKMFALTAAMLVLTLGPQLFMFLGKVFLLESPMTMLKSEYPKLGPIFAGTMMTSLFIAAIGLAVASLTSRRAYGTAAVIAVFMMLPAATEIIRTLTVGPVRKFARLGNPIVIITGFNNWLFDVQANRRSMVSRLDLPGQAYLYMMAAVVVLGVTLLVYRYRKHSA